MAIIIKDKTKCQLCGRIISANEPIFAFPAFLGPLHRLNRFSDAVFHQPCLENSTEGKEATLLFKTWQKIWDERPKDLDNIAEIEKWGKEAFAPFLSGTQNTNK